METVLWIAALAAAAYALHRLALWMERRGWIFYKHTRAGSSAQSNAFLQVQALFEPRAEHVVERRSFDEVDEAEAGDPPHPCGTPVLPDPVATGSPPPPGRARPPDPTRRPPSRDRDKNSPNRK